ncbi:MAG TPA: branched-chain amino acid ABC transporter permease [Acidimicrobiales bacterium]|nr:branched-chain amino acid ABC transporter permease [Acidimicrobiales bacterium]
MSTSAPDKTPGAPSPSSARAAAWRSVVELARARGARRFAAWVFGALVLALMTGPSGTNGAPTSGFTGSLFHPRVLVFLAIGVGLWALDAVRFQYGASIRTLSERATAAPGRMLQSRRVRFAVYAAALAVAIAYPPTLSGFWQEVLVDQIGVFVLLAVGLNVVVGYAGLLDLGYIAFYAIGAYSGAYWTGALPVHPPFHLNPFLAIPFAIAAAMLAGVILGAPTLRLRGDYLAIVTLGFGEIIQIVATNLQGVTGGAQGVTGIPHFSVHIGGVHYAWTLSNLPYYYLLLGFVVVVLFAFRALENSRVGRAFAAVREDEVAAEAVGINVLKYKVMAFAIGASTSGFAGLLEVSKIGFVSSQDFTVQLSILVLVLVIFGGMGSLPGAVAGAAFLQWVPQILREHPLFGYQEQDLYIYLGALLVVMMIFRPEGILPSRRRKREIVLAERGIGTADAMSGSSDPAVRG